MGQLHVFFFPIMAHGHMIPTLDIAKLFAAHSGVKSTIITTPLNAHLFAKSIERAKHAGVDINIITIKFPTAEAGLPEGCESADQLTSDDMIPKFLKATTMLQAPLELVLQEHRPDCLVADMFFPWATDSAAKYGIPRLVFHGISFFALCASESLRLYKPQTTVSSDDEPFVVPNLPHQIKLRRTQLPEHSRQETESDFGKLVEKLLLTVFTSLNRTMLITTGTFWGEGLGILVRFLYAIGKLKTKHREVKKHPSMNTTA
ncbi:hypothetical protein CsSME_00009638 [Camellia sinensis var. sinensis]